MINIKYIPLSRGMFAIIDECEYDNISRFNWYIKESHGVYYAQRNLLINGKRNTQKMHRFIMDAPKGIQVDHINHNGLDNRKENLRLCTHGQNQMNSRSRKGSSSQYKGVIKTKVGKPWAAHYQFNNKVHRIGGFNSEIEAALAYDEIVSKKFGEFAYLNFPQTFKDKGVDL